MAADRRSSRRYHEARSRRHAARVGRRRVPFLEGLEDRLVPSTITWIGGAHLNAEQTSGDPNAWSNPLNWLGGAVPGSGDTALFTDNVSFSLPDQNPANPPTSYNQPFNTNPDLDVSTTVGVSVDGSFGGSLTVASGVTLTLAAGQNFWESGSLIISGTLTEEDATGSYLNVETGSYGLELQGSGSLVNDGTIIQTGGFGLDLYSTTIDNRSGGVYDFQADSGIDNTGTFDNEGTLEKTAGTGTSTIAIGITLNDSNLIDADSGTIALASTQGAVSGTLTTASGASIDLTDGNSGLDYEGTVTGSGSGTLLLDDDGALTLGADTTFDFPAGMFQWTGGEIDTNTYTLTNATGSYLNVDTGDYGLELRGPGTLVNDGTIIQTGGAWPTSTRPRHDDR